MKSVPTKLSVLINRLRFAPKEKHKKHLVIKEGFVEFGT